MRKVVVSEFLSLDGVWEEPEWTRLYRSDETAKFKYDELFSSDALLLGRVTYEGFAKAWPAVVKDEQGFADRMNNLPKFVASRTLQQAEWNANIIKGDIVEEINKLKQQPGENILLYGSGDFVATLRQHNLVDQYNLLVFPLVLGKGRRFFTDNFNATFRLVSAEPFSSGVVALTYVPV